MVAQSNINVVRLETAIERALEELGVPTPDYPAPVANAVEILTEVLARTQDAIEFVGAGSEGHPEHSLEIT